MGWFDKKEAKGDSNAELPKLPRFPAFQTSINPLTPPRLPPPPYSQESPTQLPTLPSTSTGDRFSQSAIKDAVTSLPSLDYIQRGDEDEEEETPMIPQLPKKKLTREISESEMRPISRTAKAEPMFVRLDKFEESVTIIEKAKKELTDIEEMLKDTRKIKEEEERELQYWESTMQKIKQEINKIDKEIFSKI